MTTRRAFIAGILAASTTPKLTWADAGNPSYLAAAKLTDGSYALFGLTDTGQDIFNIALPARGHAAAIHPIRPEAVAFARRPGRYALVINCATGQLIQKLDAPMGRHFYGHGSYIENGEILCTSENDITTGQGVIGLWARSENYRRIGEIYSGGIGPHEIKTMPDDHTLVVANGGIRTYPDTGREKINLSYMRPNLSFVSLTGEIVQQVELEQKLHQNSIRHLDVSPTGLIAFGMQWEGDPNEYVPLVGMVRLNGLTTLLSEPLEYQTSMKNYIGSVAISLDEKTIGVTAPRGGKAHFYSTRSQFKHAMTRTDVCGISASRNGFITTDGAGGVLSVKNGKPTVLSKPIRAWDNHLVRIPKMA